MKVYVKKYVIATKEYPIMFDDGAVIKRKILKMQNYMVQSMMQRSN